MKQTMNKIFALLLASICLVATAQERCGTEANTRNMMKDNPSYAAARMKVNAQTNKWIENHPNHSEKTIITIPVVVHVVWNTNAENISDAQVESQIEILNADFRRTNIDQINTPNVWQSIAADCEIEFCLATTDPDGNVTNGINRVQTSETSFGMSGDPVKSTSDGGIDAWDNDDYMNIWVCDLGSGLLGYATPPSNWIGSTDGVVIGYKYFGDMGTAQPPYHKGRTATHEVGHWLNLDHVWGGWGSCGNDQVADTPKQEQENYSCPAFPLHPNACSTTNANGDMFMNYMDYTNDACMNLFTEGQKARMIAAINSYRQNMLTHSLCGNNPPAPCAAINPPLTESFQSGNLASGWTISNPDGDKTWEITNTAGYNSNSSIYINNADYSGNGEVDDLILPIMDLTNFVNINLTFDYAYSLWTDPNAAQNWSDTLQIFISEDCGSSWQKIWEKAGVDLTTTTPIFNGFSWIPSSNSDWASINISLANYMNEDDFVLKFRNVNQYENNIYLDNINISGSITYIDDSKESKRKLIKIVDILGRTTTAKQINTPLFYIYDDGSVEKKIIIE